MLQIRPLKATFNKVTLYFLCQSFFFFGLCDRHITIALTSYPSNQYLPQNSGTKRQKLSFTAEIEHDWWLSCKVLFSHFWVTSSGSYQMKDFWSFLPSETRALCLVSSWYWGYCIIPPYSTRFSSCVLGFFVFKNPSAILHQGMCIPE